MRIGIAGKCGQGTYLLAWPMDETEPIAAEFLDAYCKNIANPEYWDADVISARLRAAYISGGGRAYPVYIPESPEAKERLHLLQ